MNVDEDPQPAIESVPTTGYSPLLAPQGRHTFCGAHNISGADCPNCDRPLMQMMSLDASDERLQLRSLGVQRLPLMFCWRCDIAQDVTQYRLRRDGGIDLLRFKRGTQGPDFPYPDYPLSFPEAQFDLATAPISPPGPPRHQIGGRPLLVQSLRDLRCEVCRHRMRFLACVADEATAGGTFAGNAWVQTLFYVCLDDGVIATDQACD